MLFCNNPRVTSLMGCNVCDVKHLMYFSGDCWVWVNMFTGDYTYILDS